MKDRQLELKTRRLAMRPFEEADLDDGIEILCDEEIRKTYMIPDFSSKAQAEEMFCLLREFSLAKDRFVYGICLNGTLIGFLNDVETDGGTVEVGYVILPQYQNHGYATEALGAAIDELFRIGFSCVRAGFFADNPASGRVMEKCGMKRIGKTDEIEYHGIVHQCVYCEIKQSDSSAEM